MNKEIIIIGASGHGKVVADIIKTSGDIVFGYLDDDLSKKGVIGKVCDCENFKDKYFIIAIGNNEIRRKISQKYSDLSYYTAVHPAAVISESVVIGEGTVVMPNAVVNSSAMIGKHCIINTGAIVEHDNIIKDYVHISPGAVLCGTVCVGENSHIGAGAVVRNNIAIGSNVVIGAGAAVVRDIVKSGVYAGVPARELG